ncbi:NADH-quinone oxidoreductase subunit C [Granulicoccus phenolivorans]|uniref:NADH-quinone oxidoreductase subunit C n=1 Tax=Granulicoccus phenolivorans TaxID=266854 RepID=UPI00138ACBD3|nr:NADH-quinone oxidoreductase subunit C [Granulicoccus phenolivorans]
MTTKSIIEPTEWVDRARAAREAGYTFFDWLDCVDELPVEQFRVVLGLQDATAVPLQLECRIPRQEPVLDSLREVFAGAAWAERELADLFGIRFRGGDPRRVLLPDSYAGYPLRKDEILGARAVTGWPGAKEPGDEAAAAGRRRMVPPGVPDPEVWGDRAADAAPASPAEVAASAAGGRVRRARADRARGERARGDRAREDRAREDRAREDRG